MNVWYSLAAIVIIGLSGYAGWLLGKLWQQHRRVRKLERLRVMQTCDSLEVIARSLLAGQVNVSEAALRMEVLMHNLSDPRPRPDLAAVHQLAHACSDLATGSARQALARSERQRQDAFREDLEEQYGEAVVQAARRMLDALPHWRP